MSWKKWKRGLLIAILTGIGTGLVGLAVGINWEQALILVGVSVGKDLLLYLKQHPIETVSDTTHLLKKGESYATSGRNE